MSSIVERIATSWESSAAQYHARVASGTQTPYPLMEYETMFALNVMYFAVIYGLSVYMKDRPAYNLKGFRLFYNATCVCAAGYTFVGILWDKFSGYGVFVCNDAVDTSPRGDWMYWMIYCFLLQKYWEFTDTWLMVLRKSTRQLTFLHVYHHSSISIVVTVFLRTDMNGDSFFAATLNSWVHVVMYFYYFLSTLGYSPSWKRHLTSMQLFQFVCILVHTMYQWSQGPDCGFPDFAKSVMLFYMISMLVLFGNFFVKSYLSKPKKGDKKSQ
eukprot:GFYU01002492.1.p1 GENE.GFYU01002492.1~~GFYU01002492.1.p1  ORF type:complete len:270 (+),score=83.36 GFYU01002492.1:133-942(+)